MARATHLTISTADRIRLDGRCGEENEDGENEVRQEVQVSVTYALDPGDTNLVRLAAAKALEVKLAHEAVWDRIGAFSSNAFGGDRNDERPGPSSGRNLSAEEDDNDRDEEDENDGDMDDDRPGAGLPPDPLPVDPPLWGPARGAWYVPGGSRPENGTPGPAPYPDPDAEPITGPQKILIRSRAKKAGLTPYTLESLVYQQFKVWKVEKLTKEQAVSLLAALDRDLKERAAREKNGAHGSAVAAPAA